MNFFRDVVSHLLKNAFEGHTQFSVADNTAVGDNPVRSISLDAVPVNDETMISLAWEGGEKLFEKTLSEQEAQHQFELISSDLAEVASLTKQGQYDAAKDLMKKLGQKYAENTGELVQTNLPKLHNTQAAHKHNDQLGEIYCDRCSKQMCTSCGTTEDDGEIHHNKCKKAESSDDNILKQAKITMQNMWFSTTDELLDYQQKQKGAAKPEGAPLWDQNKQKAPANDKLAPASLSYEDLEDKKEQEHEDMQNHIDEKIKTELESALQEKAASVFGPDQVELVQVLRKNGRNWDEIKKILVKDFGFDKDSTNIFVDEQRQGADPTGIEVEPVKEDEKPLTPPEELVSPETHDKLLQDHEDKKKDNSPLEAPKDLNFTPKDIMDIPEDEEIKDESSLSNEIARADNDEIHKVAAPTDLNPLQEPIKQEPTTPSQDVVPMGKKPLDHEAPQKGDRVFVASDMSDEKAGFEGTFVSTYQSEGRDHYVVETDEGDLLDVDAHRVTKISENDGAQVAEPSMEPIIEAPAEEPIKVTPKMSDFQSSQDEALAIKKEAEQLLTLVKDAADEQLTMWDERGYDEKYPMMAKHPNMVDPMIEAVTKFPGNWNRIENEMFYKYPYYMMNMSSAAGSRDGSQMITEVENWLKEQNNGEDKVWVPRKHEEVESSLKESAMVNWICPKCGNKASASSVYDEKICMKDGCGSKMDKTAGADFKMWDPKDTALKARVCPKCGGNDLAFAGKEGSKDVFKCHGCGEVVRDINVASSSDFEKGISQNKDAATKCECGHAHPGDVCDDCKCTIHHEASVSKEAAPPVDPTKTQFKDYKKTPNYVPKQDAIPADPELNAVLSKMDALQQNLATLEEARVQIQAKLQAEMSTIDEKGQRVQMEAELQESIEKAAVLINAVDSKIVQWKDKLFTLQTEEVQYVPKLTQKELLGKIYEKFSGAEKYVKDVLNGMLSQAKSVQENTLIRWPNKKSSVNKEATILDDMNHFNEELMAALQALSSPI